MLLPRRHSKHQLLQVIGDSRLFKGKVDQIALIKDLLDCGGKATIDQLIPKRWARLVPKARKEIRRKATDGGAQKDLVAGKVRDVVNDVRKLLGQYEGEPATESALLLRKELGFTIHLGRYLPVDDSCEPFWKVRRKTGGHIGRQPSGASYCLLWTTEAPGLDSGLQLLTNWHLRPVYLGHSHCSQVVGDERTISVTTITEAVKQQGSVYVIYGMSGMGKSCLSYHVCANLENDPTCFNDGIICVDLQDSNYGDIAREVLHCLDVDVPPDYARRELEHEYQSALRNKDFLLVLDNFDAVEEIEKFLLSDNDHVCSVLITTQDRKTASAKPYFKNHRLDSTFSPDDCILLWEEGIGALSHSDKELVGKLSYSELLGGLPLAVDTAMLVYKHRARRDQDLKDFIESLETAEPISAELHHHDKAVARVLSAVTKQITTRPSGGAAALKVLFSLGACAPSRFSIVEVSYVSSCDAEHALSVLDWLANISVVKSLGQSQFSMHSLLRKVIRNHDLYDPISDERHLQALVSLLESVAQHDRDRHEEFVRVVRHSIDIALLWAYQHKDLRMAHLSVYSSRFWKEEGQFAKAHNWLQKSLEVFAAKTPCCEDEIDILIRSSVLRKLAEFGIVLGQLDESLSHVEECLKINESDGLRARTLLLLGEIQIRKCQFNKGLESYTKAAEIFVSLRSYDGKAHADTKLGDLYMLVGRPELARKCYSRVDDCLFQHLPLKQHSMSLKLKIVKALIAEGLFNAAEALLLVSTLPVIGPRATWTDNLDKNYCAALIITGRAQYENAIPELVDCLKKFQSIGDEYHAREIYKYLTICYHEIGDIGKSKEAFSATLLLGAKTGYSPGDIQMLENAGDVGWRLIGKWLKAQDK